jgi:hypothetical protein
MTDTKPTGLALLREQFPAHQISKLPKPTKQETEAVKNDYKQGFRCPDCGGWHHPKVIHLDYVGHAAMTDRLLDADPAWTWEPMATNDAGLPAYDHAGGLWINLTVCGVTRKGYGNAAPKQAYGPGDREKEVIGDALRNAAMRFGAALDLWHKGDLHIDDGETEKPEAKTPAKPDKPQPITDEQRDELAVLIDSRQLDVMEVCTAMKIKSLKHIPAHKFEGARDFINKFAQEKTA